MTKGRYVAGAAVRETMPHHLAMVTEKRDFILQHTRLQPLPVIPELRLQLADEAMPIWAEFAEETGEDTPPLWAFAWVGGQAVARWLLDHRQEVSGKRVLDFAAGSGLCAIAAMIAGAAQALAADIDPYACEAVALNAAANGMTVAVTGEDLLARDPPQVDVILAGDIFYEGPLAERALPWLEAAHDRGIRVLIGDPVRLYFPAGMTCLAEYDIPAVRQVEERDVKRSGVYTFPDRYPIDAHLCNLLV